MKIKNLILAFVSLLAVEFTAQTWSTLPNFPGSARNRSTSFSIPQVNKSYVLGGYAGGSMMNDLWEYNHTNGVWTQLPNFPGAGRTCAVAVTLNGKAYVATGVNWGYTWYDDFWEFNPVGNVWTQLPNVPGGTRGYATGFAANGRVYIGMGVNGPGPNLNPLNDFYAFDFNTMTWSAVANFPGTGRYSPAAFNIGNKGYVGTGVTIPILGTYVSASDFWEYNALNNTWSPIAPYPGVRGEAVGYSFCNMGVVGTGYTNPPHTIYTNSYYAYKAQTNTWIPLPNSPGPARAYAVGFVNQNNLFLLTGASAGGGTLYNDFHKLDFNLKSTVNVNDSTICAGNAVNFTSVQNPAGNASAFSWTLSGGTPSQALTQNVNNVFYNTPGLYSVYFVSSNICVKDSVARNNWILVSPNPTLTAAATPTGLCLGQSTTLTATGAGNGATYTWSAPGSWSVQATNTVVNPASTQVFTVNGENTGGCSSSKTLQVIVVNTSPVVVNMPSNVCQGANVNLTAQTNPAATYYVWSGPNSFTANGANISINNIMPAQSGVYQANAVWTLGNITCSTSNFNQVNVVGVNAVNVNQPVTVCRPSNVQLTASSPAAIGFTWNAPSGYLANIPSPLLSSPQVTASGIYTVTTAYSNGALVCYNSNTTQVTVNPIINFLLPAYQQVCFGSLINIAGPQGASTYSWSGPNNYNSNQQNLYFNSIQPVQEGEYLLTVSLGPCQTSGKTKIEVLTPITLTLIPSNKNICKGDSVALYAGASGGSHNYAYTWNPQQWLGSPTGSVQYGHPQGTTIYNLNAHDIACPHYTVSGSFTVNVKAAPVPQLDLDRTAGCEPLCVKLNSQVKAGEGEVVFDLGNGEWLRNDDFTHCFGAGMHNIKIKVDGKNGCSETFNFTEALNVWPAPHADFTYTPDEPSLLANQVTFLPTNQYGEVVTRQWQFSGAQGKPAYDVSEEKNPVRHYEKAGNYPVLLISTTEKGCKDTVLKVIEVRDGFAVYIPNSFTPNSDGLNDVFAPKGTGIDDTKFSMQVFDRWGAQIFSTNDIQNGWDGTVGGLMAENGSYVYKINVNGADNKGRKEFCGTVTLLK